MSCSNFSQFSLSFQIVLQLSGRNQNYIRSITFSETTPVPNVTEVCRVIFEMRQADRRKRPPRCAFILCTRWWLVARFARVYSHNKWFQELMMSRRVRIDTWLPK